MVATSAATRPRTRHFGIGEAEYARRLQSVRRRLDERGLDAIVLFYSPRIMYLSGFTHVSTERPMALVVAAREALGVLVPALEQEHVRKSPVITHVKAYPEYPSGGTKHPMLHLADLLGEMDLRGRRIGVDRDGYADVNGYVGPTVSQVTGVAVSEAPDVVDGLRQVKSESELDLIRESAVWGNLAHRLLQDGMAVGRTEIETTLMATAEASRMMLKTLGRAYQSHGRGIRNVPVSASFIAGSNTALPHGLRSERGLMPGDAIITGASANVGGYHSELERTMVVGEPTPEFRRYFEHMLQIQDAALAAFRPGRTCAEVEADVVRAFVELGVQQHQRHHTGHGIGVEGHEQPFVDLGDDTVVEPGMVFSVEPGVYVVGVAGFRHSDTIIITPDGCELVTFYPRDLDSLVVPV
ncbi:MAG TPA: Xaa-Pro peptidase family protein [Thermomicrobiaceae bacterium]|nr:Xaa-Pro peptidase family protein [Thermomicrobiaceae bacterium]